MTEKRITLKDIALECGVTPTLVSAVLNGRSKHILCSPRRREEIRTTAARLGYRPNVLARSMTGKSIPIVALLLHFNRADADTETAVSSYVIRCMTGMAFALNRHGLEMLFIPYITEKEQIRRIDNLYKDSLIGAVVTNILPDSHHAICIYLKNAGLPYMVLGAPQIPEVHCAYMTQKNFFDRVIGLAAERGLACAALITQQDGELIAYGLPLVHDYIWHTAPRKLGQLDIVTHSTLFAVMGMTVARMLREKDIKLPYTILVESAECSPLIPPDREVLLVTESVSQPLLEYTERTIRNWMESSPPQGLFERVFCDSPSDIVLRTAETKTAKQ